MLQYGGDYGMTVHQPPPPALPQHSSTGGVAPPSVVTTVTSVAPPPPPATTTAVVPAGGVPTPGVSIPVHESLRRYVVNGTSRFFGVNGEEANEKVWIERRRRIAIKLFGGVKDDFHIDGNNGHHGGNTAYEDSLVRILQQCCFHLKKL